MNKREEAVYIISVAAELAGVHPQTLRIYERKGLIEPYRTPGGTRRYSDEDLGRLGLIQELTTAGVNLEGVRRILALQHDNDRLAARSIVSAGCSVTPRLAMDRLSGGHGRRTVSVERRNLPDIRAGDHSISRNPAPSEDPC